MELLIYMNAFLMYSEQINRMFFLYLGFYKHRNMEKKKIVNLAFIEILMCKWNIQGIDRNLY